MTLHIAPIEVQRNPDGTVSVVPTVCLSFPENTEEYKYIAGLIKKWDYYVSRSISIPDATCRIEVSIIDSYGNIASIADEESGVSTFIYGWMPDSTEWFPGQCVAFVNVNTPMATVEDGSKCMVHAILVFGDIVVADEVAMQNISVLEPVSYDVEANR